MDHNSDNRLKPYFTPAGIWAFSIGTAIGWGSFVVTCNAYLAQAGILGTAFGLILGMLVILVITHNLIFMVQKSQDAGGIYTFTRSVCGPDYGFLTSWFLLLTYLAVLWANITSVPLFTRYFLGNVFRFGFHYQIFGYEVWFGEALLSILAFATIALLLIKSRKVPQKIEITAAAAFVIVFTLSAVFALLSHQKSGFSFEPLFLEGSSALGQIVHIAVISPWAFIGFENITHFSEEFNFPVTKTRGILRTSVIVTTILYLFVTLLSVSAYPPEYDSWLAYLNDMENLEGIKGVPAFYAAYHYWGNVGVAFLLVALFGVILTSLIGNTTALSRLLYAMGKNNEMSTKFTELNRDYIPSKAILFITSISVLIPFLGRTAIGWIVDVTTLGSTIIYGFASYAVFRSAQLSKDRKEMITGFAGTLLMVIFATLLLIPSLMLSGAMASESYMLFTLWAILGLMYFRRLVIKDTKNQYAQSIIVWVILLLLVLFASMMWVSRATQNTNDHAMAEIHQYYHESFEKGSIPENDMEFLQSKSNHLDRMNALYTVASFVIFIVSTTIMLTNYNIMKKREKEHQTKLREAESKAATDPLTGIKNRLAYEHYENNLNEQIKISKDLQFAIVIADVNNLKSINDKVGHSAGDECIRAACKRICHTFKHSPVFRIGGDEFAVILQGADYEDRQVLLDEISKVPEDNQPGSSLAVGMAEYISGKDNSVASVFIHADRLMYQQKSRMKRS